MSSKIRATIDSEGVRQKRHDLYASVLGKINEAIAHDYYLEAITLLESIIADRLESICNEINRTTNYSYRVLGDLIKASKSFALSEQWNETIDKLDEWRRHRNNALHEMAKLEQNDIAMFEERYSSCKAYADNGKKLFREIDNQIRNHRKSKSKIEL